MRGNLAARAVVLLSMKYSLFFCLVLLASPAFCRPDTPPPMRVLHWAQFPVRVYFAAHGLGQTEEVPTALAGFDEWGAASHGKIRYVRVSDPSKADITVQFVPGRYLSADTLAVGETTIYSSDGVLQKASMRLAEGAMLPEELQATAAHEFGHALGISGHSSDPDDVMYPVETVHFDAQEQPLRGETRTVTAHDLQILAGGYPGLLPRSDKQAAE